MILIRSGNGLRVVLFRPASPVQVVKGQNIISVLNSVSRAQQSTQRRQTLSNIRLGNSNGGEIAEYYPAKTMRLRATLTPGAPIMLYATSSEKKDVWAGGVPVTAAVVQKILESITKDDTVINTSTTRGDDYHTAGDNGATSRIPTADWNIPAVEGRLKLAVGVGPDGNKVFEDFAGYVLRADHFVLAMVAANQDVSQPGLRATTTRENANTLELADLM